MNRVWHGTGHCFLDGRPWSGWRAQRTRFMVSSTTVSFGANLLATVQAHLEAMPRPQSQPKSPPESGPEPTAISFCAVCERPFFGASERAWAGPLNGAPGTNAEWHRPHRVSPPGSFWLRLRPWHALTECLNCGQEIGCCLNPSRADHQAGVVFIESQVQVDHLGSCALSHHTAHSASIIMLTRTKTGS